jgi:hypothetical protein
MSIIQGNAHTSTGGYQIERSLRFNSADSAYLNRTPASASNRKTWTWSGWVKRGKLGTGQILFKGGTTGVNGWSSLVMLMFTTGDVLRVNSNNDIYLVTNAVFRDPSAWYYVSMVCDTTQASASNRLNIYVNGVLQTYSTDARSTYISQNSDSAVNSTTVHEIGRNGTDANYLDGYLTEIHFIDGQALTPSSFGETDTNTGVWKPKAYSGTYGTNGFYLKFADNSGTTSTTLGKDSSGNGNNWTPNNFSVGLASSKVLVIDDATKAGSVTQSMTIVGSGTVNLTAFGGCGNISGSIFTGIGSLNGLISDWQTHTVYKNGSSLFTVQGGAVNNNSGTQTATQSRSAQTVTQNNVAVSNGDVISIAFGANNAVTAYYGYPGGAPSLTVTANSGVSISDYSTTDSFVDSPTAYGTDTGVGGEVRGNYCTWNPLDKNSNGSLVNGNLDNSNGSANNAGVRSTFDLPSSDKWYAELRVNTTTSGSVALGFGFATSTADLAGSVDSANKYDIYGSSSGYIFSNTSTITSSLGAFSSGDILQVAYDGATGKAWLGKNNTWYNSTGGTTGNPGAGTNQTFTLTGQFFLYSYYYNVSGSLNCGQRAFAYTAPSGFKALCTQNLPTPAIAKGNQYFDVLTWSGTGGSSGATRSITGLNFQPDFLWEKARSSGSGHQLLDVVRGVGQNKVLASNSTGAEPTPANTESLYGWLSSFNSDGFTTTNGTSTWDNWNKSGDTYVAWNWKAGGTGVTNTTGTITSTVSANTTAGFSIVVYTGNGIDGATVGHGLGVVPSMVIQKRRDGSIANFRVWHSAIYATSGVTDTLFLNSTAASGPDGDNISGVSSTTFTTRGTGGTNPSGNSCVAYVFAAVPGYSAFGKYTGNGSADGSFIYLGFRPEFVIIKRTDSTGNWITYDAVRGTYNVNGPYVYSNSSATEATSTTVGLDFLSNGFKNRNTYNDANTSSATYIYMAFAENPFKYSLAR